MVSSWATLVFAATSDEGLEWAIIVVGTATLDGVLECGDGCCCHFGRMPRAARRYIYGVGDSNPHCDTSLGEHFKRMSRAARRVTYERWRLHTLLRHQSGRAFLTNVSGGAVCYL